MKMISMFVLGVVVLFVLGAILAIPTMLLVNALFTPAVLVALFGSVKIGFWQAFMLNLITGILFRSSNNG